MRAAEGAIPANERLYRSANPANLVDGDRLLAAGVDLPSTSCNRERYSAPESVFVTRRPLDVVVVVMRAGDLPAPQVSPAGITYAWRADDVPLEENDAHAEVRLLRDGVYSPGHRPASKAMRDALSAALADKFRALR